MSISKLKRSIHSDAKAAEAIREMIRHHYKQVDELENLYKAMTGKCVWDWCTDQKPCGNCRDELAKARESVNG